MDFQPFPDQLPEHPLKTLETWLDEAVASLGADHQNPTAMTLATCGADQVPDARVVLCRGFDAERGVLTYFTDRSSRKGRQQAENARAAIVFYWESLYRQVRAAGPVVWAPDEVSDRYFASRPGGAQASSASSQQSQVLAARADLEARHAEYLQQVNTSGGRLPRPARWGGMQIWIERLEFWVGRKDRLHDRVLYQRTLERSAPAADRPGAPAKFKASDWSACRLQP